MRNAGNTSPVPTSVLVPAPSETKDHCPYKYDNFMGTALLDSKLEVESTLGHCHSYLLACIPDSDNSLVKK